MLNGTMFQSFEDLFTAWAKAHCDEDYTEYCKRSDRLIQRRRDFFGCYGRFGRCDGMV